MNKFLIIALIGLSLTLACHYSCECHPDTNTCNKCKDENSCADKHNKSCPCNEGYYRNTLPPYECIPIVTSGGTNVGVEMDACELEIARLVKDILVKTECLFDNSSGASFVISKVYLDQTSISMSEMCFGKFSTSLQFLNPQTNAWEALASEHLAKGENGAWTIRYPLIEIYNLSIRTEVNDSQISQTVNLRILIGHSRKVLRIHCWYLYIYTNRNKVNLFQLDVDIQRSNYCDECIIMVDLETVGTIYTDETFTSVENANKLYVVGDIFYARIVFADASYTKKLTFRSLYYKNDVNFVFDFTSLTVASWDGTGLRIALTLVEPSLKAYIQVNMQIDPARQLRSLEETGDQQAAKQQFEANVATPASDRGEEERKKLDKSSAFTVFFGIFNLLVLLFLF